MMPITLYVKKRTAGAAGALKVSNANDLTAAHQKSSSTAGAAAISPQIGTHNTLGNSGSIGYK